MNGKEIPVSYYYLQLRLWEESIRKNQRGKLNKSYATGYLGEVANIEKRLRVIIMKELEDFGLIKTSGKFYITIKPIKLDKDTLINKWYRKVGLF